MSPESVKTGTSWQNAPCRKLATTDSTQKELERWWREDHRLPEGSRVSSGSQTEGKGRHGRTWATAPGALAMSVLLRPTTEKQVLSWLPAVAALALVHALEDLRITEIKLKWPNDVLLHDHKIAGILCQLWAHDTATNRAVVGVGFGVNLRGERAWFRQAGLPAASSLEAENKLIPCVDEVAEKLLTWLNVLTSRLQHLGAQSLQTRYTELLADTNRWVTVRDSADRVVHGHVETVGNEGQLMVRDKANTLHAIVAGIVEWEVYELAND